MTTDDIKRFNALDENQKLDYSGHGCRTIRKKFRSCFEMVHENYYRLFFSRFFDDLMEQWGREWLKAGILMPATRAAGL